MTFPNPDRAIVDLRKLEDYCLDSFHPRGKHKAKVFESALGLLRKDAPMLRDMILERIETSKCVEGSTDLHGARFSADLRITVGKRSAIVATAWMIRDGEDFARLTTCYI